MIEQKINIAIDGYSSCGKSTLAKDISKKLGYLYIDSGAMYRAVALFYIENGINPADKEEAIKALPLINIDLKWINDKFCIYLNGIDVTQRIIAIDVSSIVSEVAAISEVRRKLVKLQQAVGENKGVVMDGRDIGTVVFPNAELKLFVTANIDVRTERRFLELKAKGMPTDYDTIQSNLNHRDNIDSSRDDSPLLKAEDAVLIDNSYMTIEEQLFLVEKLVAEKCV